MRVGGRRFVLPHLFSAVRSKISRLDPHIDSSSAPPPLFPRILRLQQPLYLPQLLPPSIPRTLVPRLLLLLSAAINFFLARQRLVAVRQLPLATSHPHGRRLLSPSAHHRPPPPPPAIAASFSPPDPRAAPPPPPRRRHQFLSCAATSSRSPPTILAASHPPIVASPTHSPTASSPYLPAAASLPPPPASAASFSPPNPCVVPPPSPRRNHQFHLPSPLQPAARRSVTTASRSEGRALSDGDGDFFFLRPPKWLSPAAAQRSLAR